MTKPTIKYYGPSGSPFSTSDSLRVPLKVDSAKFFIELENAEKKVTWIEALLVDAADELTIDVDGTDAPFQWNAQEASCNYTPSNTAGETPYAKAAWQNTASNEVEVVLGGPQYTDDVVEWQLGSQGTPAYKLKIVLKRKP